MVQPSPDSKPGYIAGDEVLVIDPCTPPCFSPRIMKIKEVVWEDACGYKYGFTINSSKVTNFFMYHSLRQKTYNIYTGKLCD